MIVDLLWLLPTHNSMPQSPILASSKHAMSRGVPQHVLKQLLCDIEEQGGLHSNFTLRSVCDSKPTLYGHKGTPQRRAIQNKTQRLKLLHRREYLELLAFFGIQSSQGRQRVHEVAHTNTCEVCAICGVTQTMFVQLLCAIENQGGLHGPVPLQDVFVRHLSKFGTPGSVARVAIETKIKSLHDMTHAEYSALLAHYGIDGAKERLH